MGPNREVAGDERAQSAVGSMAVETVGKVESPHQSPRVCTSELPVVLNKISDTQIILNALLLQNFRFDDSHPNHDLGVDDRVLTPVSSEFKVL